MLFLMRADCAGAENQRVSTVGMPARIDQLVLPGPELQALPLKDDRTPIVVRIVKAWPHGTAFRYDLVYYGLEKGKYDLKNYLRRKDSSAMDGVPSIWVEIKPILPPGQIEPHALETAPAPYLGGYLWLIVIAVILWLVGLLAILLVGRKKKQAVIETASRPLTLADHLQPLVEKTMAGTVSRDERAEMERLLLAFWRKRLLLESLQPAEAMAKMRNHEEAGHLIRQLEAWLHQPGNPDDVDVAELLKPYREEITRSK